MSWLYGDEIINEPPEGVIGFIYLITNLSNGKKYIGKKLFLFSKVKYKTVKLKNGKKKRKKIKSKVNSDWQNYWSSSEELKIDVKNLGTDNFKREILRYCYSKNELSYYEAKEQFARDVLLDDKQWYNRWISVKVRKI